MLKFGIILLSINMLLKQKNRGKSSILLSLFFIPEIQSFSTALSRAVYSYVGIP